MKQSPRPRQQIYDLYWYFAAERQAILDRRVAGAARPWTHDLILQTFKFCNVYRAVDRVSQYMIREVACSAEPVEPVDRLFQIVAFRTFSKIETWRGVRAFLGRYPTLEDLGSGSLQRRLSTSRKSMMVSIPVHLFCARITPTAIQRSTLITSTCSGICS